MILRDVAIDVIRSGVPTTTAVGGVLWGSKRTTSLPKLLGLALAGWGIGYLGSRLLLYFLDGKDRLPTETAQLAGFPRQQALAYDPAIPPTESRADMESVTSARPAKATADLFTKDGEMLAHNIKEPAEKPSEARVEGLLRTDAFGRSL